ncbi:carbohydrate ABC transporter substrate-binding protein (CUT1 family) [Sediminihabitans luteus]|uniref:Carbohydrate ABC transporter substrate-binding protein (CUT1 family) n=1 Tax=Sediminihabitans luteus TaxID=1138585 RepID=A0A2M9CCX3_9CELL|nr:extracellular solute-binding protein [Sediminihabitans luteus]PJJ69198.1 carbohydrate ABC transporter substrate-binding protein (CUT1 family) [Sediminihabitans luteus]GII98873.1 ABC transporter substrate-binding protein [Sediminihabitans luteus]
MNSQTQRRSTLAVTAVAALVLSLTACSSGGSDEAGSKASGDFEYLSLAENTSVKDALTTLSTGACAAPEATSALTVTTQPQASFDQQLQLLAGQGALPTIFATGNSPEVIKDIHGAGQLVDIGAELDELGKSDAIIPAARSTIEALYDGEDYVLPTEFNVEGIWYNKTIFADQGLTAPTTWDELVSDAAALADAGVTPLAAAGKDGWPLTRLVGNYIYRELGPDALQKVADGDAKLTDPEYVEAAAKVAELGAAGGFGPSVGSIDYTTAMNQFLTGKAGMYYMGSWALANFNDEAQNTVGADNIGFVPFPDVEGGVGDSTQLAANIGVPLAMSESTFDDGAADWLGCIADNFGTTSLQDQGVVTGFAAEKGDDLPALTSTVLDQIDQADTTVLWFEALFNPKATTTSTSNAQLLVTGQMSPEDFMAAVQADLG